MPKTIEEEFQPEQVSYVDRVWTFLAENGRQGAWLLSLDLMGPVYDLVKRDAQNLGKYRTVSEQDSLNAQYIHLILPLLESLNAPDRANFAQGFLEHVVEWYLEE